jgi:hypothetical protein
MQTGPSRTRVSISASVVTKSGCRVPALSHSTPSRSEAASLPSRLCSNRNLRLANVHLCRPLRASDPRQDRTSPTSKCITCARRASQTQKKSRSARAQAGSSDRSDSSDLYEQPDEKVKSASAELVVAGEDAANFQIQEQSATSWSVFSVLLIGALSALYAVRAFIPYSCVQFFILDHGDAVALSEQAPVCTCQLLECKIYNISMC